MNVAYCRIGKTGALVILGVVGLAIAIWAIVVRSGPEREGSQSGGDHLFRDWLPGFVPHTTHEGSGGGDRRSAAELAVSCKTKEDFIAAVKVLLSAPADFKAMKTLFGKWFQSSVTEAIAGLELLPEANPTQRELKSTAFRAGEPYVSASPEWFLDAAVAHTPYGENWVNFVFSCVLSDKGPDALFEFAETKLGQGSVQLEAYNVIVVRLGMKHDPASFRKLIEFSRKSEFPENGKYFLSETQKMNWSIGEADLKWAEEQGVSREIIASIRATCERNKRQIEMHKQNLKRDG